MARTILEIYDEMVAEKQSFTKLNELQPATDSSQTLLTDLTSSSKVAIWRLIFSVMAVAIWAHEKIFDIHTEEIEARALELITGTIKWYVAEIKKFQYGDELEWNKNKYVYLIEDVAKQIITQSAIIEATGGLLIVKVAKDDGSGGMIKLTTGEKTSFTSYLNKIKFAGTNTTIISDDADDFKVQMNIYYDALVLNSDGTLISDASKKPVEIAITDYIKSIPFNSYLKIALLIDKIQAVNGVNNVVCKLAKARYGLLPFTDLLANSSESYLANAGYLAIDGNLQSLILSSSSPPGLPAGEYVIYDEINDIYNVGDNVKNLENYYICTEQTTTPEPFDSSKWDEVNNIEYNV